MSGKVQVHRLSRSEKLLLERELWGTLSAVHNHKRMINSLQNLLTESEQIMLARRIQIAKHLLSGESYVAIRIKLKVGFATIQSVDRWMKRGCDTYRKDFPALYEASKQPRGLYAPTSGTFEHLRKKYPWHFLLFNLLLDHPQ